VLFNKKENINVTRRKKRNQRMLEDLEALFNRPMSPGMGGLTELDFREGVRKVQKIAQICQE
jgi:hypothetical protein